MPIISASLSAPLRFDFPALGIILFMLVLPLLLTWLTGKLWAKWEATQHQAAQREGRVFPIPAFFRAQLLFVVFTGGCMCLALWIAALQTPRHITWDGALLFTVVFAPLIGGALYVLYYHNGLIVLSAEAISLRRWGKGQQLRYDAITAIQNTGGLSLALQSAKQSRKLRIPGTVEEAPELYEQLLERVAPPVREATLQQATAAASLITPDADSVYRFAIRRRAWALYIAGIIGYVILYLGLGLIILWQALLTGIPITSQLIGNALGMFALLSVIFFPGLLYILYHFFFSPHGPFEVAQPGALELHPREIRYRWVHGAWQTRPVATLQRVWIENIPIQAQAQVNHISVMQTVTYHTLILEFADKERVVIDQRRARHFGVPLPQLQAIIQQLYG